MADEPRELLAFAVVASPASSSCKELRCVYETGVFFRFIALDIGRLLHVDFLYMLLYADGDEGVAHVGRSVGSVSYTHLDVYKRQEEVSALAKMPTSSI